jgi:RND family efflux transporter MFP subunit
MPAVPDLASLKIDDRLRQRGGGKRRAWWIALAALALVAALAAMIASRPAVPEVEVATVTAGGDVGPATALNASGYVTPRRRATVAAKITGQVRDVFAEEGMEVETGQVLATLDDAEAQRQLAAAVADLKVARASVHDLEVNLANAERDLKRAQNLQREGVTSAQALDQATTAVDSFRALLAVSRERVGAAEAAVAIYRQNVDNCTVRAPFAGIVVSKDAQRGEMVSPVSAGGGFTRTGIATIVDMASLEVEVDVNESYIAKVTPGQRVLATLDAYPDWKIPANVRTVIPTADRQKATVKVRIRFDALDPRILPDMGVKVAFLAEQQADARRTVAIAPSAAVREEGGVKTVFVVNGPAVERRAVSVGAARGNELEILSGLTGGEKVVVGGPAELKDGQRVRTKP